MSLAVVRSLGRAGIPVHCLEDQNTAPGDVLAFRSRYASKKDFVASSCREPQAFIDDLLRVSAQGDVVIPISLSSIMAIAANLSQVAPRLKVVLPSLDSLMTADDTGQLLDIAERIGVPVPGAYAVGGDKGPEYGALEHSSSPIVIKYRKGEALQLPPEERYAIVRDAASFVRVYEKMRANQACPLVQEYVPGEGYGMSALFIRDSEPVAVFCHRRIREYPVTGGPSCFAESVWDPRMVDYGVGLLKELRWRGVAMVEFKGDIKSGEYKLMEINPRFWGSLPLAILAGVDFPVLLYRAAAGQDLPLADLRSPAYSTGVRMRYLFQDLLSVRGYMRREAGKAAFAWGFVKDLFDLRVSDGVFQWDDPAPNFAYALRAFRRFLPSGGGGAGRED